MITPNLLITDPNYAVGGFNAACVFGVTCANVSVDENGRTGSETTVIYEGQYLPIKNQQAFCRQRQAYTLRLARIEGGTRYRLTVVYPFDENGKEPVPLNGVYELDVEMDQPDILTNPTLNSLLPPNIIALVKQIHNEYASGGFSTTSVQNGTLVTDYGLNAAIYGNKGLIQAISDTTYQARAIQLFATLVMGTNSWIVYHNVLRRTITAASPQQLQSSNAGVDQIWTSSEVSIWENIPAYGWFALEPDLQWLKCKPEVVCSAAQRTQLMYNYTSLKQANGLLYKPFASAKLLYADPSDLPVGF